jgi:uncharacterized membrane protein YhaH (DUF805 family)
MREFLTFNGRIGRASYWLRGLGIPIAMLVPATMIGSNIPLLVVPGIGLLILCVVALWAAMVRRFHDRNKSGAWYFLNFIPIIGPIWVFIELGFLAGTNGVNRYGYPQGSNPPALHVGGTARLSQPATSQSMSKAG